MNVKNQPIKALEAKPSDPNSPKLTVKEIVEKFVQPSTNRKFVQLSAAETEELLGKPTNKSRF